MALALVFALDSLGAILFEVVTLCVMLMPYLCLYSPSMLQHVPFDTLQHGFGSFSSGYLCSRFPGAAALAKNGNNCFVLFHDQC